MIAKTRKNGLLLMAALSLALSCAAVGEANAKRVQGGKKLDACDKELGSTIAGCAKMPSHMTQGLAPSVYEEAIRECENDAAKRYDQCLTVRELIKVPDAELIPE